VFPRHSQPARTRPNPGYLELPLSRRSLQTSLDWSPRLRKWFTLNIDFSARDLSIRLADEPTGPWSAAQTIYNITPPWVSSATGAFSYSPKHHRELQTRPDELILTFMSNAPLDVLNHAPQVYVPQALRVIVSDGGASSVPDVATR
jgi:hypothetical protein